MGSGCKASPSFIFQYHYFRSLPSQLFLSYAGLNTNKLFQVAKYCKSSIKPHGDLKFISSPCEGKKGGLIEIVGLFNSEKNDGINSP